jgi:hypothetical protein
LGNKIKESEPAARVDGWIYFGHCYRYLVLLNWWFYWCLYTRNQVTFKPFSMNLVSYIYQVPNRKQRNHIGLNILSETFMAYWTSRKTKYSPCSCKNKVIVERRRTWWVCMKKSPSGDTFDFDFEWSLTGPGDSWRLGGFKGWCERTVVGHVGWDGIKG